MNTKISIIIPTFNRDKTLTRAIRSVQNQSFLDWELLIIDDFSTDNTKELVLELSKIDSRIKYFHNIEKGGNRARNVGLEYSSGKYLVFLDSDDELKPLMLEKHFSILESLDNVPVSISLVKSYNKIDSSIWISGSTTSKNLLFDFLLKKISWPINSALIRKDFLNYRNIIFHSKLLNGQDYCFFLEVLSHKPKIFFINEVLSINYHEVGEPFEVKVSAGDTLKYKLSRMRSRNIAFRIAYSGLNWYYFKKFLLYYIKYQIGISLSIIKENIFEKKLTILILMF
jgi:glycosyltransferase involved in cell wall biosynthesis